MLGRNSWVSEMDEEEKQRILSLEDEEEDEEEDGGEDEGEDEEEFEGEGGGG